MLRNRFIVPDWHCFTAEADNKLRVREVRKSDGEHLRRILGEFVTRTSLRNDLVAVMYSAVLIEPSSITITLTTTTTTTRSAISRLSARSSCPAFRARILSRHGPIRSITDRFIAFRELLSDPAKIELGGKYSRNFESCGWSEIGRYSRNFYVNYFFKHFVACM